MDISNDNMTVLFITTNFSKVFQNFATGGVKPPEDVTWCSMNPLHPLVIPLAGLKMNYAQSKISDSITGLPNSTMLQEEAEGFPPSHVLRRNTIDGV